MHKISVSISLFYLYFYKAYTNLLQNVKIYQNLFKTLTDIHGATFSQEKYKQT